MVAVKDLFRRHVFDFLPRAYLIWHSPDLARAPSFCFRSVRVHYDVVASLELLGSISSTVLCVFTSASDGVMFGLIILSSAVFLITEVWPEIDFLFLFLFPSLSLRWLVRIVLNCTGSLELNADNSSVNLHSRVKGLFLISNSLILLLSSYFSFRVHLDVMTSLLMLFSKLSMSLWVCKSDRVHLFLPNYTPLLDGMVGA